MENAIVRKCTNCGNEFTLILQGEARTRENGHFYSSLCDSCWEKLHGKPRGFKPGREKINKPKEQHIKAHNTKGSTLTQKYRAVDLAADLNRDTKEIVQILKDELGVTLKSNLQRLQPDEIAFVLEFITQKGVAPGEPVIVAWDDFEFDGFYIIRLANSRQLSRDSVMRMCSESEDYYEDYESALEAVCALYESQGVIEKEIKMIKLSDFAEEEPIGNLII